MRIVDEKYVSCNSLLFGKNQLDGKYNSDSYHLLSSKCLDFLLYLSGFHLYVWVVPLEILFSEAVAVVQQKATTEQRHCLTHLEVSG